MCDPTAVGDTGVKGICTLAQCPPARFGKLHETLVTLIVPLPPGVVLQFTVIDDPSTSITICDVSIRTVASVMAFGLVVSLNEKARLRCVAVLVALLLSRPDANAEKPLL